MYFYVGRLFMAQSHVILVIDSPSMVVHNECNLVQKRFPCINLGRPLETCPTVL